MSQRFQNGLKLEGIANYSGRILCRYMVEWLTQVVGWSVHDEVSGNWTNVAGSGSTCESTSADTLEITSPSYAFSASDEDQYLTLTGFSTANRDGVYRIKEYVGAAGSVYTIKIDTYQGPHHLGMSTPDTGLSWRYWKGDASYVPTANNICVIEGEGKTGAGQNEAGGTGDSIAMAGSVATLTDAGANFQISDVGKTITLSGCSNGGNNGPFEITARNSATQITYTNASGVNETSAFTWAVTYKFHVHIQVHTGAGYMPKFIIAPFASWNNSSHSWDDNKYTTSKGMWYAYNHDTSVVWAEADTDHFTISTRWDDAGTSMSVNYCHIGEFDTFYPESDPNPCIAFASGASTNTYAYAWQAWGLAANAGGGPMYSAFKGLSHDDITTLTYYFNVMQLASGHVPNPLIHYMRQPRRRFSEFSGDAIAQEIVLESRTSGHMEYRGKLRKMWAVNHCHDPIQPFGTTGNYLHTVFGMLIPWNGAKQTYERIGHSATH